MVINDRDKLVRESTFNPLLFPDGRNFQQLSRYLMPRTTKIGKTQINQTIKTGDRITVGAKRNQTVKVALANPQKDDLDTCNLSEDLK